MLAKKKKMTKKQTTKQLTSHLDLLHDLQQLHFGGHVAHGPHALGHVFVVQVSVLVVIELLEGVLQLWRKRLFTASKDFELQPSA